MAKSRKKTDDTRRGFRGRQDVVHIAVVTLLLGSVLGTLALGAATREERSEPVSVALPIPSAPSPNESAQRRFDAGAATDEAPAPTDVATLDEPRASDPSDTPGADRLERTDRQREADRQTDRRAQPVEKRSSPPSTDRSSQRTAAPQREADAPAAAPRRAASPTRPAAGAWTLQFLVTCVDDKARSIENRLGGDPDLRLVPLQLDGRSCWRVLWGSFATEQQAQTADYPAVLADLADLKGRPLVRALAEVQP